MVLRRRLSTGLPLSNELLLRFKTKTDLVFGPGPRELLGKICCVVFGGLAIMVAFATVDPWLCVTAFRRFCYYRFCSARNIAQSQVFVLFIFVMLAFPLYSRP